MFNNFYTDEVVRVPLELGFHVILSSLAGDMYMLTILEMIICGRLVVFKGGNCTG